MGDRKKLDARTVLWNEENKNTLIKGSPIIPIVRGKEGRGKEGRKEGDMGEK